MIPYGIIYEGARSERETARVFSSSNQLLTTSCVRTAPFEGRPWLSSLSLVSPAWGVSTLGTTMAAFHAELHGNGGVADLPAFSMLDGSLLHAEASPAVSHVVKPKGRRVTFAPAVNLEDGRRSQRAAFIARAFFRVLSRMTKASATRVRRRSGLAAYRLRVRERRRASPTVAVTSVLPGSIDAQAGTPRPFPGLRNSSRPAAPRSTTGKDKRKEAGQGCLDAMFLVLKQSTSNSHAIPSVVPPHLLFDCHSVAIRNARIWKLSTENGLFISSMIPGTLMPASFVPCGRAFIPWRLLP
jgi:hypothetical protein